jgi:hypothetical protein
MSTRPSEKPADVLTVFLTGNELGTLKPCGCSGGQLGGLDRRSAVLNTVPVSRRMVVDTGSLVRSDSEQDQIKFDIIIEAFNLLGYDVVSLAEQDIEMARSRGLLVMSDTAFNIISSQEVADVNVPVKFTKRFSLKNTTVTVTVAAFDAETPVERVRELFASQVGSRAANILLLNRCDARVITSIAEMGIVDCLVCPPESDEPKVIGDPNRTPLVVSVGRYGKYVGSLQITAPTDENKVELGFEAIPLTEDLPQESSLVELYKAYQQFVRDGNLLDKPPRFSLPNDLEYAGSQSCSSCHSYEYEKWSTKAHAHAYATLEKVGSQYDPECVICHVVGFEYQSGFVSEQETGHLKNVGCENCHGPGSKHSESWGEQKTTGPMSDCSDCHTPETSGEYAGNELLYLEKIVHWREPNSAGNVK